MNFLPLHSFSISTQIFVIVWPLLSLPLLPPLFNPHSHLVLLYGLKFYFISHFILQKPCYDDACHLKSFVKNPKRSTTTPIATRLAEMEILCDRLHFKNRTDVWCKTHCNPHNSNNLKVIYTIIQCLNRKVT